MKLETMSKWVSALTSGKYTQGKGSLKKENIDINGNPVDVTYCCLGVLLECMGDNENLDARQAQGEENLNTGLRDKYGLSENEHIKLIAMNDGGLYEGMRIDKHNFVKIAEFIETRINKD